MRHLPIAIALTVLCGCAQQQAPSVVLEPADPKMTAFLVDAAAKDFREHGPKAPLKFRNLQIGHIPGPTGQEMGRLFGEVQEEGKPDWVAFATVQTPGEGAFEQYLGQGTATYKDNSAIVWNKADGLQVALETRLKELGSKSR